MSIITTLKQALGAGDAAPAYERTIHYCEAGGHSVVVVADSAEHVLCHCQEREEECEQRDRKRVAGERVAPNGRGRHG